MNPPYDYRTMVPQGWADSGGDDPPAPPRGHMWIWPVPAEMAVDKPSQAGPVRIGDAERDRAIAALGDHFAAGRLSREEFDERVETAMQARFDHDLEPLFADLPVPVPVPEQFVAGPRRPAVWPILMWLMPLVLLAAVITAVLVNAPFILWGFFWVFLFSGLWRRRQYPRYRYPGPPRSTQRW
jgi:hypothetical protein